MLLLSLVSCLFTYAILRLQHLLPLNPQALGPMCPDLAFNTAVSFTTNTNWQSVRRRINAVLSGSDGGADLHNFVSAAAGIAIAAALVRGIARHSSQTLGSFWVDLVRTTYYLFSPLRGFRRVPGLSRHDPKLQAVYQSQACPTFTCQVEKKDTKARPFSEPTANRSWKNNVVKEQTIAQGPVASQVAIKMLGTNGGGFMNANAAHPFENPTPLSNFLQMLSIFSIGSGLTYYLGRMVRTKRMAGPSGAP